MEIFSEQLKRDHLLVNIDPRLKLLMAMALLGMVLSYRGFVFPVVITGICFILCAIMRVPLRVFLLRFSEPLFIVLVIIMLKVLTSGMNGLKDGLLIALRIIGSVSVVAVLGFSTPFVGIISALSWLRLPRALIEILMLTYRYIFVLLDDAVVIYNAQKNRLGYSTIRRGLDSFGSLTGALILKAFEHSNNITVSMIQRGYDGNFPMLRQRPFKATEVIVLFMMIIALGVIWRI